MAGAAVTPSVVNEAASKLINKGKARKRLLTSDEASDDDDRTVVRPQKKQQVVAGPILVVKGNQSTAIQKVLKVS